MRLVSGYWCEDCARKKTAISLVYTGLVGWWGFFGAFLLGTARDLRELAPVWKSPRKPLKWGALTIAGVAQALADERAAKRDDRWSAFDLDEPAQTMP